MNYLKLNKAFSDIIIAEFKKGCKFKFATLLSTIKN